MKRTFSAPRLCADGRIHWIPRQKKRAEIIATFWSRVEKTEGCWLWTGGTGGSFGYGRFAVGKREVRAHRFSYELHFRKLSAGKCVLHHCDNPICVRPSHLFVGTRLHNNQDSVRKGRNARGERSPLHKLTNEEVLKIRASYLPRVVTQSDLAKKFNVSTSAIQGIVEGKRWKHLLQ